MRKLTLTICALVLAGCAPVVPAMDTEPPDTECLEVVSMLPDPELFCKTTRKHIPEEIQMCFILNFIPYHKALGVLNENTLKSLAQWCANRSKA